MNDINIKLKLSNRLVLILMFVLSLLVFVLIIRLIKNQQKNYIQERVNFSISKTKTKKFENVCITSGTDKNIQKVLIGKGAKAKLCQNAIFKLNKPVTFTAVDQELFTEGLATDSSRALLKIVNKEISIAVNAYNQSGVKIRNIQVDGNRTGLGRLASHGLIMVGGNATNQEVDHVKAFDTRSWTTIHVNWGDFYDDSNGVKHSKCKNVKVTNNEIGPSGWAENGEWADGISLQCENSLIASNNISDVTDGGIVIFGAPGSYIVNNTIKAENNPLFLGIGLVDYAYDGNYTGTTVTGNTVTSNRSFIRIGIGMGPDIWWCPKNQELKVNRGGIVTNNRLIGQYFGYGYAISGVKNWLVEGNISNAQYIGGLTNVCGVANSSSSPFLLQRNNSEGTFQDEFVSGNLQKINDVLPSISIWLIPFCSGTEFRGCNVLGYERCSNWGDNSFSNWGNDTWKLCKDACSNQNPDKYCTGLINSYQ